jgi:hypothetical protein
MKAAVLAVLALAVVVSAQPWPVRPQISETFEGEGYTHIVTPNETIWGLGRWVIDEPAGHGLEFWDFNTEHRHHGVHFLRRFDLGFEYSISWLRDPTPHAVCHKRAVTPPMPPVWAWIKEARYHGKHVIDGTTFDLWRHHVAGIELEVAVSEHDASRPHYFIRRTPSEHRVYHLISWATFKPNNTWFNVPDVCKNATLGYVTVDGDDTLVAKTSAVTEFAERIATTSNGFGAAAMVVASMNKAGVEVPSTLESQRLAGARCDGGAREGDVFFDGASAAIYLGGDRFAECSTGGQCSVVSWRDFIGGCRRFF